MKDYNDIPFKNAAIDRLTSMTTPPHGRTSSVRYSGNIRPRTSEVSIIPPSNVRLTKETALGVRKKSTGLEYEPKVRKRHMKP